MHKFILALTVLLYLTACGGGSGGNSSGSSSDSSSNVSQDGSGNLSFPDRVEIVEAN